MAVVKILDDGTVVDDRITYGESFDESIQSHKYGYERGYEIGANDAWKLAKKVFEDPLKGGFTKDELYEIFDVGYTSIVMADLVGIYAVKKYREYEKKKKNEINVGDEVCQSENSMRVVVTKVYRDEGKFDALGYDGTAHSDLTLNLWEKTGQRCEIEFKKTCEKGGLRENE